MSGNRHDIDLVKSELIADLIGQLADLRSRRNDLRKDILRIHDLKTGETPTHMEQLMVYAALFCLEYDYKPNEIDMELRIYQNDTILYHKPTIEDIFPIMDRIVTFDKIINSIKEEEE